MPPHARGGVFLWSNMTGPAAKFLHGYSRVRHVNDLYWAHTTADADGRVSVENLEKAVTLITGLRVEKYIVTFKAEAVRGAFERYPDHVKIFVRSDQSAVWIRFTVVKELCHALCDIPETYSVEPVRTIQGLLDHTDFVPGEHVDGEVQSERIAELMAMELLYPFEIRDGDIKAKDAGLETVRSLSEKRGIPSVWVERALEPVFTKFAHTMWGILDSVAAREAEEQRSTGVHS